MIEKIISIFSKMLLNVETKCGRTTTSAIIALFIFIAAIFYGHISFTPQYHGVQFSLLSENPFDFSYNNPLRYRILAPLLGYSTFLRGQYFFKLPLIFCYLFISSMYYNYREKSFSPVDSFVLTCLLSFSCVILIPLFAPAYTDIVTYFFLFLAFCKVEKIRLSAIYFSLALLNHESALFLLPGLILYSLSENKINPNKIFKTIVIFLVACMPHICYRYYVNQHIRPMYDAGFYLSEANIYSIVRNLCSFFLPAVFYTFKLVWVIPLMYILTLCKNKKLKELLVILVILGGAFAQLLIAYDYTRMLVLAFPAILISAENLKNIYPKKFTTLIVALFLINLLITQYQYNFDGKVKMAMFKKENPLEKISKKVLNNAEIAKGNYAVENHFSGN